MQQDDQRERALPGGRQGDVRVERHAVEARHPPVRRPWLAARAEPDAVLRRACQLPERAGRGRRRGSGRRRRRAGRHRDRHHDRQARARRLPAPSTGPSNDPPGPLHLICRRRATRRDRGGRRPSGRSRSSPRPRPGSRPRSIWSSRRIASVIAGSSAQRNPVVPSSTTSGAAPSGNARTGVPQAMRLEHDEAERLVPADREEQRRRPTEKLELLLVRHLAEVDRVRPEQRLDHLREVPHLRRPRASSPPSTPASRPAGPRRSRGARPCRRAIRPRNRQYGPSPSPSPSPTGNCDGVDPVVDDPRHRDLRRRPVLRGRDADDRHPVAERPVEGESDPR